MRCEQVAELLPGLVDPSTPRDARQAELDAVTRDITLSETRKAELKREIDALDKDRTTLNQSLIDANLEVQKLEAASDRTERGEG